MRDHAPGTSQVGHGRTCQFDPDHSNGRHQRRRHRHKAADGRLSITTDSRLTDVGLGTAGRGGFNLIAQGMGGIMHVTGEPDGPPTSVGLPICDLGTGMWAR